MAENAKTLEQFDRALRSTVQEAIDAELSRPAIAGIVMAMSADFNQSKSLMAAYETKDEDKADPK